MKFKRTSYFADARSSGRQRHAKYEGTSTQALAEEARTPTKWPDISLRKWESTKAVSCEFGCERIHIILLAWTGTQHVALTFNGSDQVSLCTNGNYPKHGNAHFASQQAADVATSDRGRSRP
ncbi:hypothetical protein AVEN_156796-1 [Araneus ventricosus]|uniref:Uncharacterized protein n=1 Tax=Araneus ventricosus TaxID=182803 RepID=A0A4Y2IUQ0_ARAVE|nr:hypothetical protein AVEN_156796-1 [Araneus ventricosus]